MVGPIRASAARRPRWWGTLLYLPLLYLLGWLAVQPLVLTRLLASWRPDQVALLGTLISFLLLLASLPRRLRWICGERRPWRSLGVAAAPAAIARALLRGLLKAVLLLGLVAAVLLLRGEAHWQGQLQTATVLNALLLLLGLGFAEELVFRGWLWRELSLLFGGGAAGEQRALLGQALLFALVHPWYQAGGPGALGLLGGLTLLGLVLALQRRADGGLLWGAVGLHGGLVGGWLLLSQGLLRLEPLAPAWLVGPGGSQPNPVGGLVGWFGLAVLLLVRRRWWRVSAPPGSAHSVSAPR